MNQRQVGWLYQQLPLLVEKGVLTQAAAESVQHYYGPIKERSRLFVFGLLGGGLIGLGIILLIANNWAFLSHGWRLGLSLTLLLAAQGIALSVRMKRPDTSWQEGAALFWAVMVGASLALVAQTYHLSDDTSAFLLTWTLLILPIAYLMESTAAIAVYVVLAAIWAQSVHFGGNDLWVWGMLSLIAPLLWRLWWREGWSGRAVFAGWCLRLAILAAFSITAQKLLNHLSLLMFAAFFLRGRWESFYILPEPKRFLTAPRRVLGTGGLIFVLFIGSFRHVWQSIGPIWKIEQGEWVLLGALITLLLPPVWLLVKERRKNEQLFATGFLTVAGGYALAFWHPDGLASAILVNAYLIGFCVFQLIASYRSKEAGGVNGALLLLSAVILARFFDVQISFLYRGLAFILLGVGFLMINRRLLGKGEENHD